MFLPRDQCYLPPKQHVMHDIPLCTCDKLGLPDTTESYIGFAIMKQTHLKAKTSSSLL